MTRIVRNLSPTHVLMVAGFLRQQIRRAIAEGVRIPNAQLRMLAVGIRFLRAYAIESQIRILDRQHPFNAERRNRRQIAVLFTRICNMQIDVAKHIGNVTNGDLRALRNRKLIRVSDGNCGFAERLNLRINATRILSGNRPLRTLERMARAAIIVGQRTERGDQRLTQHEFALAKLVRHHATLCKGEQGFTARTACADIPAAQGDRSIGSGGSGRNSIGNLATRNHALAERKLIPSRSPIASGSQLLGRLQNQFLRTCAVIVDRPIDLNMLACTCGNVEAARRRPNGLAISQNTQHKRGISRRNKQIVVGDRNAGSIDGHMHVRVQLLDVLRLRRRRAVGE